MRRSAAARASLYEGGVRVPAIVNWPGKLEARRVVNEPLHMVDVMPTLLALAGGRERRPPVRRQRYVDDARRRRRRRRNDDVLINVEAFRGAIRKATGSL